MRLATVFLLFISVTRVAGAQDAGENLGYGADSAVEKLAEEVCDLQPHKWTYSELAARSDLIVVAKAVSRSEIEWDNAIAGEFDGTTVTCISNKLRVLSTLKGRSGDEIVVITVQWKPPVVVRTDFDFAELRTQLLLPSLVRLVMDGEVAGYGGSQPIETYKIEPEYLLYVRKLNGKEYVPVTGQRYSGMSVRTLNN
jgi:hypothetical protein